MITIARRTENLPHPLGIEFRRPNAVSQVLDDEQQTAFIKAYNDLLNQLNADEAVLFANAVYPAHAVRPIGGAAKGSTWNGCMKCAAPKHEEPMTDRRALLIHS